MAQTNSSGNETSFKQLLQSMMPDGDEIMEGTVIQTAPLRIQMTNDEKHVINERVTIVPWHLTDYTTRVSIQQGDGALKSSTEGDGRHDHGSSGEHGHTEGNHIHEHGEHDEHVDGDGSHIHEGGEHTHDGGEHVHIYEGPHTHHLVSFELFKGIMTVHNALRKGDKLHILSLNNGKLYYVLDRVAGQEVT